MESFSFLLTGEETTTSMMIHRIPWHLFLWHFVLSSWKSFSLLVTCLSMTERISLNDFCWQRHKCNIKAWVSHQRSRDIEQEQKERQEDELLRLTSMHRDFHHNNMPSLSCLELVYLLFENHGKDDFTFLNLYSVNMKQTCVFLLLQNLMSSQRRDSKVTVSSSFFTIIPPVNNK
jgi:hypothetical protein